MRHENVVWFYEKQFNYKAYHLNKNFSIYKYKKKTQINKHLVEIVDNDFWVEKNRTK